MFDRYHQVAAVCFGLAVLILLGNRVVGGGPSAAEVAGASDLAVFLSQQGRYAEAARVLEDLHARTNLDIAARLRFAATLYRAERYDAAEAIYRDLLEESRDSPLALFNLAQTVHRQGRAVQAGILHREVIERFGALLPELAARSTFMLEILEH